MNRLAVRLADLATVALVYITAFYARARWHGMLRPVSAPPNRMSQPSSKDTA